jgi:hypothetical protein
MKSRRTYAARAALARVAARYTKQGYKVHILPSGKSFPVEIVSVHPDIILERKGTFEIVEVNFVGQADHKRIEKIATAAAKLGWKLWFVVLKQDFGEDGVSNATSITSRRLKQLVEDVDRLLAAKHLEAAFVMAWAALEGAMRRLVAPRPGDPQPGSVMSLLSTVTSKGYISQDLQDLLRHDFVTRNALVHGVTHPPISKASVQRILRAINDLEPRRLAS